MSEARDRVRRRLAWLECQGFSVEQLDPMTWEVTDDGTCISGHCGLLAIRKGKAFIQ